MESYNSNFPNKSSLENPHNSCSFSPKNDLISVPFSSSLCWLESFIIISQENNNNIGEEKSESLRQPICSPFEKKRQWEFRERIWFPGCLFSRRFVFWTFQEGRTRNRQDYATWKRSTRCKRCALSKNVNSVTLCKHSWACTSDSSDLFTFYTLTKFNPNFRFFHRAQNCVRIYYTFPQVPPFCFQFFPDFERFFYFAKLCVLCNLLHPCVHTHRGWGRGRESCLKLNLHHHMVGRDAAVKFWGWNCWKAGGKHQCGWVSLFAVFISCFAGKGFGILSEWPERVRGGAL